MEIKISEEQAKTYFQKNKENGWIDTGGKPIRNWKKAMAGYFKKVKENDEDSKPEPIPIPPILEPAVLKIVSEKRVC